MVSQKCQYALRAVFELAKHYNQGPMKIGDVAKAQAIPARFLEVILSQLKQGGFVESRRGNDGGYLLIRPPQGLTAGEIIRFVEGPLGPVMCVTTNGDDHCPLHGSCVFLPMWEKARDAMSEVYDSATLQDLLEDEARMRGRMAPTYSI